MVVNNLTHLNDGIFTTLAVNDEDLGAELLSILSKGLYSDPMHCIREYAQNGVDADASEILVKVTANSVLIRDNGSGLDLAGLIQARQFGVSLKDPAVSIGFRGIGIYSSFDICRRFYMTTKQAGSDRAYVMELDWAGMKHALISAKRSGRPAPPLREMMEAHSRFSQELARTDEHYTIVHLEEITSHHIGTLADFAALQRYILRNLPIDFDSSFEHRTEINAALRQNVSGYKAVSSHSRN